MLRKWDDIPDFMRTTEVRPYWEILNKKRGQLLVKRGFDLITSLLMLIIFAIPMLIIAIMIKCDSEGPVFYRQERVTTYGRHFRIHKFRTMVNNADKIGTAVTVGNVSRITGIGSKLRKYRIEGKDIIRQTTESLVNQGFCERDYCEAGRAWSQYQCSL